MFFFYFESLLDLPTLRRWICSGVIVLLRLFLLRLVFRTNSQPLAAVSECDQVFAKASPSKENAVVFWILSHDQLSYRTKYSILRCCFGLSESLSTGAFAICVFLLTDKLAWLLGPGVSALNGLLKSRSVH